MRLLLPLCLCAAVCTAKIPGQDVKIKKDKYKLAFPPGDGPFPLAMFFHARLVTGKMVDGYSGLVQTLLDEGFATLVSLDRSDVKQSKCVDWVIDTSLEGAKTLSQASKIDFSRVGAVDSMGGGCVINAAASAGDKLKAVVGMHPWVSKLAPGSVPSTIKAASCYLTGSKDPFVPAKTVKKAYDTTPGPNKLYASLKKGDHNVPMDSPVGKGNKDDGWSMYTAKFMACHVMGDDAACAIPYKDMPQTLTLDEFTSEFDGSSENPTPEEGTEPEKPEKPAVEDKPPPPGDSLGPGSADWVLEDPEAHGLSKSELDAAWKKLQSSAKGRDCFLVIKDGAMVYEQYKSSSANGKAIQAHSATKTVAAMIAGNLVQQGKLDIDKDITSTYGVKSPKKYGVTARAIMSQALAGKKAPGEKWSYDAVGSSWINTLPKVVNALNTTAKNVFESNIKKQLGLSSKFKWSSINTQWATGSVMTCRDLAKFGQLMLNRGDWPTGRILPEDFVGDMGSPQTAFDYKPNYSNTCYGLLTWLSNHQDTNPNEVKGKCITSSNRVTDDDYFPPSARHDVFFAAGLNGQIAMAVPEHNAVVVSMGSTPGQNSVATYMYKAMAEHVTDW